MLLSKCAISGSKTSRFIKEQKASRFLTILGLQFKVPLFGDIFLNWMK